MDFLKSAVASAISKGPAFGYTFGDRVDVDQSIWTLHNGTKREDGSKCSIFSFDISSNKSRLPLARNALRKLRTLRHPGVIKVLDTVETDTYIYIATERLTPLSWYTRRKSLAEETVKWGLHNIAKTLKFINGDAASVHGCVRVSSVFAVESGEWKLGGFDILSSMKEDDAVIYTYGSLVPDSARYAPPEIANGGWEAIKRHPLTAVDAYNFGQLIFEAFNGTPPDQGGAASVKGIPQSIQPSYKRLLNASPKARISIGAFLDQGSRNGGFFQTPLIQITEDIEGLGFKADDEKAAFLNRLDEVSDDFPEDFFKMKVLPELLKSVEFGGGGPKVFSVVMKISTKLSEEEYDSRITPVIVRLFALPDRAMRVTLLQNLPLMIDHLSQKIISDKIFPQLVTGFADLQPVVREETVKAIIVIVPKLSDRLINGELLRHLAKTANDPEAGIRTNTTIVLGRIARNMSGSTRSKVLSAAFARSLRDPFVPARNAALQALAATADLFGEDDCATKMLPGICPALVDKEKMVRDQANKTLDIYLQRIRKYAQTLPDTVQAPAASTSNPNIPRMGTPSGNDAAGWAGWAISSFTNKLASASGEIQPNATTTANGLRPSSVPPTAQEHVALRPSSSGTNITRKDILISQANKSKKPFNSTTSPPESFTSDALETEDFDAGAWGDDHNGDNATSAKEDDDTAAAFDPFGSTPAISTAPAVPFDDKGEPDFAGWLSAQSQAKSKKPLPKGLAKPATSAASRPAIAKSKSTGTATITTAKSAVPAKKPEVKKAVVEDEGWGDAWD